MLKLSHKLRKKCRSKKVAWDAVNATKVWNETKGNERRCRKEQREAARMYCFSKSQAIDHRISDKSL